MKNVLFLIGTRPEVIKVAPLIRLCQKSNTLKARLCTSGQHAELLKDALAEFALEPDISFTVWGSLSQKTAECLTRFEDVIKKERPDAVVVQGDTLTAYAGALTAFYHHVPVFHIEAGLRTPSVHAPFPEEFYRRAIDSIADLCFAPTDLAANCLYKEGKERTAVHIVGNTVLDTLHSDIRSDFTSPLLKTDKKLVLMTLHRRETQGTQARDICEGVKAALIERKDAYLLFPVHPSPEVKAAVYPVLNGTPNITLLSPLDRKTFRNLLATATLVLTDSGGVSEEATALGVPTLILREVTERKEGIAAGVLHPIGSHPKQITQAVSDFLDHPRQRHPSNIFGDGSASPKIINFLEKFFQKW